MQAPLPNLSSLTMNDCSKTQNQISRAYRTFARSLPARVKSLSSKKQSLERHPVWDILSMTNKLIEYQTHNLL